MLTVRANGYPLHSITPNGAVSAVSFTTSMRGPLVIAWDMALPRGFTHPALRPNVLVEVCAGPKVVASGTLADRDLTEGRFTADGLHRLGDHFDAAWTTGVTDLDSAIDDAISRGLAWTRPDSISSTFDITVGQTITQALDAWAEQSGRQWMVGPTGVLRAYDLPTAAKWALTPDTPAMPTADDDYASALVIDYSSGVTYAASDAAQERLGRREQRIDLTSLGLSASEDIGEALLANSKARMAFTDGVQVSKVRLANLGGVSPEFWQVRAGLDRVRHHGVLSSDGAPALGPLEWVVGATSYTDGEGVVALTPMGRLPRAHAEVVASQQAQIDTLRREGLA